MRARAAFKAPPPAPDRPLCNHHMGTKASKQTKPKAAAKPAPAPAAMASEQSYIMIKPGG